MLSQSAIRVRDLMHRSKVSGLLDCVGDVWTYRIMRSLLFRPRTFEGLISELGISRGTLTARLHRLEDAGLAKRREDGQTGYVACSAGAALFEYILLFDCWADRWHGDDPNDLQMPENKNITPRIGLAAGFCANCDFPVQPSFLCRGCGHQPLATQVKIPNTKILNTDPLGLGSAPKQTRQRRGATEDRDGLWYSIMADRWSALVVACQFFGLHKFSEIEQTLGIPASTLSNRLQQLTQQAIIVPHSRHSADSRAEYILSAKGLSLYPTLLAAIRWAEKFVTEQDTGKLALDHILCGRSLDVTLNCMRCKTEITTANLRY